VYLLCEIIIVFNVKFYIGDLLGFISHDSSDHVGMVSCVKSDSGGQARRKKKKTYMAMYVMAKES
jgi:hypothetical protein